LWLTYTAIASLMQKSLGPVKWPSFFLSKIRHIRNIIVEKSAPTLHVCKIRLDNGEYLRAWVQTEKNFHRQVKSCKNLSHEVNKVLWYSMPKCLSFVLGLQMLHQRL